MLITRKASVEDAHYVASRCRQADVDETIAHLGMSPSVIVPISVMTGGDNFTIVEEATGLPIGMYGVSPHPSLDNYGVVWMLLTSEVERFKTTFIRRGKPLFETLHKDYELIGNYVDARNSLHIRWLKRVGFTFLPVIPEFGNEKRPFYPIIHVRKS